MKNFFFNVGTSNQELELGKADCMLLKIKRFLSWKLRNTAAKGSIVDGRETTRLGFDLLATWDSYLSAATFCWTGDILIYVYCLHTGHILLISVSLVISFLFYLCLLLFSTEFYKYASLVWLSIFMFSILLIYHVV